MNRFTGVHGFKPFLLEHHVRVCPHECRERLRGRNRDGRQRKRVHIQARASAGLDGHFLIAEDLHESAHDIHPLSKRSAIYLVLTGAAFKGTNTKGIAFSTIMVLELKVPHGDTLQALLVIISLLFALP